jgi:peptide/nickel transport system permease protein
MKNIFRSKTTQRFFRVVFARKIIVICALVLLVLLLLAIFAPLVSRYDPNVQNLIEARQNISGKHPLGTDALGRDVLTRIFYGGRVSFTVGLVSALLAGGIGMVLGLIAGMSGGIVDTVIMRMMDMMSSIPMIIMAMFLSTLLGKGLPNICIAIGISMSPAYARMTRGQVLSVRESDYVTAGTLCGASKMKNAFYHVLPNCLSANVVMMTNSIGAAILGESALSYLGLGINPPTPSWGGMVSEGQVYLSILPVIAIAPGLFIMLTVLCFNMVGDAVRDATDPKLKGTFTSFKKRKKKSGLFGRARGGVQEKEVGNGQAAT